MNPEHSKETEVTVTKKGSDGKVTDETVCEKMEATEKDQVNESLEGERKMGDIITVDGYQVEDENKATDLNKIPRERKETEVRVTDKSECSTESSVTETLVYQQSGDRVSNSATQTIEIIAENQNMKAVANYEKAVIRESEISQGNMTNVRDFHDERNAVVRGNEVSEDTKEKEESQITETNIVMEENINMASEEDENMSEVTVESCEHVEEKRTKENI